MITDNVSFDFCLALSAKRNDFISLYGTDMNLLISKQYNEENLKGYSDKPLLLIRYWALFLLCTIITHNIVISGDSDYDTYNAIYDLDTMSISLQKENIDITKAYKVFSLFGYSM